MERLLKEDNYLNYFAGPIKIEIITKDGKIKISYKSKWNGLSEELLEVIKEAWEIEDSQIEFKEIENNTIIIIKYTYKNLKLYIEHIIKF